ncbi:MAG: cyclic nucleotide-binding domain-containing protein [Bacteroidota bacterium]|nr:cyclic nucleotide-binding domain-containing protein [Bacteroidota bacterium]
MSETGEGAEPMSEAFLWKNVTRKEGRKNVMDILRGVPLFESLGSRYLRYIERVLHRRTYMEGEPVFRAGDRGFALYIIETGEIAILDGKTGKEITHLREGDFFGELALVSEQPRDATAVALKESHLYGMGRADFLDIVETHPRLGVLVLVNLARVIAERLQQASIQLKRLTETGETDRGE